MGDVIVREIADVPVVIMPGRLQTNRVVPTGIDQCVVEFDYYYTADGAALAVDDLLFSEQVQEEDRVICEYVQRAYQTGRYQPGRLSPAKESGVWHWHNLLRRIYEGAGSGQDGPL